MTDRIPADALLRGLDEHSIGMALSEPISARLDDLVALVEGVGERTNRKELLGALILAATPEGAALAALVHRYRTAEVRDTLVEPGAPSRYVRFPPRRPGPKPRK